MKNMKKKKEVAKAPLSVKKKKEKNVLFEKRSRDFGVGRAVRPRVNLSRYVKWPRYVRVQRQRRVLLERLKVPPALNQLNYTLGKAEAASLLRLLARYRPETKKEKAARQKGAAEAGLEAKRPLTLKSGLSHVTNLVEYRKAKLVVLAHDVSPPELVLWLPALCRRKEVPYCVVKGKSRLGALVHQKTAAVLALEGVRKEDQMEFDSLVKLCTELFNDNVELRKRWGGHLLGFKSRNSLLKKEKLLMLENAKKMNLL